jgi:hypothetical protein
VHVADLLEQEGRTPKECQPALDLEFIRLAGAADRLDDWREAAHAVLGGDQTDGG